MNFAMALLTVVLGASPALPVKGVVLGTNGKPAAGADVYLMQARRPNDTPLHATTGSQGEFLITESPDKPLDWGYPDFQLVAFKQGQGIAWPYLMGDGPSAQPVNIKLRPVAPYRLRIVDPQQKPVANTEVQIWQVEHHYMNALSGPHFRPRTNENGELILQVIPPGLPFELRVQTETFGKQSLEIYDKRHVMRLSAVGRLRGKLKARSTTDLAGVPIRVFTMTRDGKRGGPHGHASAKTDAEGRYDIPILAAGGIYVSMSDDPLSRLFIDRVSESMLSFEAGETKELDLPVIRGVRISGKIIEDQSGGKPVAGVKIQITDRPNVGPGGGHTIHHSQVTGADGAFECYGLPGNVEISIKQVPPEFLPSIPLISFPLTIKDSDRQIELIRLTRGVPLSGTVVDEENRPVAGADVQALWLNPQPAGSSSTKKSIGRATIRTNDRGEFRFPAVSGTTEVFVTASDATRGSVEQLVIKPGTPGPKSSVQVKIAAAGLNTITGKLVDAYGSPVVGASVRFLFRNPAPLGDVVGDRNYVRFRIFEDLVSDANGNFRTPHPVSRLAAYSLVIYSNDFKTQTVPLPAPAKDATVLSVPDVKLVANEE